MSGANAFKLVMLPPQNEGYRAWAARLAAEVPEARVVVVEDEAAAAREIVDADAAFGGHIIGKRIRHKIAVDVRAGAAAAGRRSQQRLEPLLQDLPHEHPLELSACLAEFGRVGRLNRGQIRRGLKR